MNENDPFLEGIRRHAAGLRYRPSDAAVDRLRAGVRDRLHVPGTTPLDLMARWFIPIAATLLFILGGSLGALWFLNHDPAVAMVELSGEMVIEEDYYRAIH